MMKRPTQSVPKKDRPAVAKPAVDIIADEILEEILMAAGLEALH